MPVANKERGEIQIPVNGKTYVMRPNLNALARVESLTGLKGMQLMQDAAAGGIGASIALVWSYLQKYHADEFPTLDAVGDWIEEVGGLDEVNRRLEELTRLNTEEAPQAPAVAGGNPAAAQAGVGETLSPTDSPSV